MIREYYKHQVYVSVPALNGAMCNPGEITSVYYIQSEGLCDGTIRFYWTDGWSWGHLGRYKPEDLERVSKWCLNKPCAKGDETFNNWIKVSKTNNR